MSREYHIDDLLGHRQIAESDLPLNIGGLRQEGIVLPGTTPEQLLAYIALSQEHVYVQATNNEIAVFLNDERLSEPAWLKSGDRIQIEDSLITWTVQGDRVLIAVHKQALDHKTEAPVPAPINSPLPTISNDLPVHTPEAVTGHRGKKSLTRTYVLLGVLFLTAAFLLLSTPVSINLQPAAQNLSMKGFPPPLKIGSLHLAMPGHYTIEANLPGYIPLQEEVDIKMGSSVTLNYTLNEFPGLLHINTEPAAIATLQVDGVDIDVDAGGRAHISRGNHHLRVTTAQYLPYEQTIEIKGYGQIQQLNIQLQQAWANIFISSQPAGAQILVDGKPVGRTPLTAQILQGQRKIELTLPGYKTISITRDFLATNDGVLDLFQMLPVDGRLSITSLPAKASVSLDGKFIGTTPMDIAVLSNEQHHLNLTKPGYAMIEKEIKLLPNEMLKLNIKLQAQIATVFLTTSPKNATLQIDGKLQSKQNGHFELSVRPHVITLSKRGYASKMITVTPRPDISQSIEIELDTARQQRTQQQSLAMPTESTSPGGQTLKLIRPEGNFSMGASRRDAGRRANESQRLVALVRPFYIAVNETTNHEYRLFRSTHQSGTLDGADLNDEQQPVVNVSWDDAARYCNWLSQKQGLPQSYVEENGKMRAVQPMTTGYRLPTEAEWAWVARRHQQRTEQRYPWAGRYPPEAVSGNYADTHIADALADVVPGYDDGYRGTAAVGSFPARPSGIYDLGGNVSEWMHDYYAIYPDEATKLVTDPAGPLTAAHRVVRGAGWRHGNITELRLSYRDYSNKPRYDLGFRIARYAR